LVVAVSYIPPIAEGAMDGALGRWWLVDRRTGNDNSKSKMRGFFAALRMTKEKREIRLTGKPRRSAALCGVVAVFFS
jgi:hypothetical protein